MYSRLTAIFFSKYSGRALEEAKEVYVYSLQMRLHPRGTQILAQACNLLTLGQHIREAFKKLHQLLEEGDEITRQLHKPSLANRDLLAVRGCECSHLQDKLKGAPNESGILRIGLNKCLDHVKIRPEAITELLDAGDEARATPPLTLLRKNIQFFEAIQQVVSGCAWRVMPTLLLRERLKELLVGLVEGRIVADSGGVSVISMRHPGGVNIATHLI